MKTIHRICLRLFILTGLILISSVSCKKDEPGDTKPKGAVPVLETVDITFVTQISAISGGFIVSEGDAKITARGVCWNTSENPTVADSKTLDGTGTGTYKSDLTKLAAGVKYYVRAYATSGLGTGYGNQFSFTTDPLPSTQITFNSNLTYGSVSDIDGNAYKTILIGTQTWMAQNLKTTKYRNGDQILNITDNQIWFANTTSGAYCAYNNLSGNGNVYGLLYNGYAVEDSRKICPAGWHVPTDPEWVTLKQYLGGVYVAGGKMKETGNTHWPVPSAGTNESGFTALPGGSRDYLGNFSDIGYWSNYFSSTNYGGRLWYYAIYFDVQQLVYDLEMRGAVSVRCIKD
jgi:uncharacterized protein (TIGR02145 family)